jgi:hypothetical protein
MPSYIDRETANCIAFLEIILAKATKMLVSFNTENPLAGLYPKEAKTCTRTFVWESLTQHY